MFVPNFSLIGLFVSNITKWLLNDIGFHHALQVALGQSKRLYEAEPMERPEKCYHSVTGLGEQTPDHNYDIALPTGAGKIS